MKRIYFLFATFIFITSTPTHAENIVHFINKYKSQYKNYECCLIQEIISFYENNLNKENDVKAEDITELLKNNRNQLKINSKDYFFHSIAEIEILYSNHEIIKAIQLIHDLDENKELLKNKIQYTDFLITAAKFYFLNNQIQVSNTYNFKFLHLAFKSKNTKDIAIAYANISVNYGVIGNLDHAIYFAKMAIAESAKSNFNCDITKKNLAELYFLKGNYTQSEKLYLNIYELFKETNGDIELALARLYIKTAEYKKCKYFIELATKLINQENNTTLSQQLFAVMADYFKSMGKYVEAIRCIEKRDSLIKISNNLQTQNSIDSLEIIHLRNKFSKKEQFLNNKILLNKKLTGHWRFLFYISIFIGISGYMKFSKTKKKNKELVYSQIKNMTQDTSHFYENLNKRDNQNEKSTNIRNELNIELINKMEKIFFEKKLYLKNNISLQLLSKKLGSNTSEVSQLINVHYGENFRSLVNKMRINEAKIMFSSQMYKHFTIEGVAITVGYKNQSTFNKKFKELTGVTPSFFQKTANEMFINDNGIDIVIDKP